MAKRYYYKDMAKVIIASRDFGIRFCDACYQEIIPETYRCRDPFKEGKEALAFRYAKYGDNQEDRWLGGLIYFSKCMVLTESMPIFEPQEGDIDNKGGVYQGHVQLWIYDEDFRLHEHWYGKIIQRNGKMFPWYCGVEEVDDE
ncbi:hypothetical protein LCGC14_1499480 [marine sediment metagenome]|uniref:Uncharacterized protein n=1 Tax=marine sediment metagenome TaxID=412755 RepID=A0A0F9LK54_9ZZZZ|nr:hypothetical protein [Candidatus Scalindua sp.]